ncbi:MAG: TIGR00730 family Rossman fold protein [Clostridia bacterium]|nr:TIGR00730 family Rossman fold protein [Clostridia bacterium]
MNICVFGASSSNIEQKYLDAAYNLGKLMAQRGYGMVFGGGANGIMGATVRGADENGGKSVGVAPRFFDTDGILYKNCTEFIFTDTMRERKQIMEDRSDAFIVAPGGIGTFEEFFEILTLKQLGRHGKPIAVLNTDGYYDDIERLLKKTADEGFMRPGETELCSFFDRESDVLDFISEKLG